MEDLLVLPVPAKTLQNGASFEQTGPAEKERVTSVDKESSWQIR